MPSGLEIVLTIGGIGFVGVLLAVVWVLIQRGLGIRETRRPREDGDLQMHQAQRNGSAGFGP